MKKNRKIKEELYPQVENWADAPEAYQLIPLKEGEYTVIVDPSTGRGVCLIVKSKNSLRFHSYIDGFRFKGDFKKVMPMELSERFKERRNSL